MLSDLGQRQHDRQPAVFVGQTPLHVQGVRRNDRRISTQFDGAALSESSAGHDFIERIARHRCRYDPDEGVDRR